MDIYEYLKMDHEKVSNLFKQFEKNPNNAHKLAFIDLIRRDLTVHAESEQKTFYKILEQFEQTRKIAQHGEKEHKEIEDTIEDLKQMKSSGKSWENHVEKLKKLVEHHVKEEEGKMFKEAKKVLTAEEALIIKEKMHYLKGKLLESYEKVTK